MEEDHGETFAHEKDSFELQVFEDKGKVAISLPPY
jgi:hypothetical protein